MCPTQDAIKDLVSLAEKDVPSGAKWRIIDADQVPSEPQWKWKWTDDGALLLTGQRVFSIDQQKSARSEAYRNEADPLFFKVQRGEATMDEWLAIVAEIKMRYPYPT